MGAHAKELEPYTEFITKDVDEDGIKYALEHFGLI
jgi:hydroxymethylpyrimidine pyrophosphatase-like HAD family hydrolase